MKITATKENLLSGVSAVQRAVSSKNTLPILNCIKLEAKENRLYFSATDLEIGIQCHVPVDIVLEGVAVVPARYFSEIVRKLPDVSINIALTADNELVIQYEQSQLSLKTLQAGDYPNLPDISGEFEVNFQAKVLKQMIRQTVFSASTDEGRPLFTGVLCEMQDGVMRLIATDTHRLSLRQGIPLSQSEGQLSIIIPAKMLSELARLISDDEDNCIISMTKNLASFSIANIRIICRLLDGQFPNYRQVIPTQYNSKIKIKTKKLQEAVERISLFTMSNDNSNTIHLRINGSLVIITSQSELGQGYEQIDVENEGDDVEIYFNSRYLLDVFKIIESETMSLEFTGPLSPCIVRPAENNNFIYLVLPVRS